MLKLRPDYSCSCSVSCVTVNVDGFTSPSTNSTNNRSHVLERFATVSVRVSVHTGNSHPESLQREQCGRFFNIMVMLLIILYSETFLPHQIQFLHRRHSVSVVELHYVQVRFTLNLRRIPFLLPTFLVLWLIVQFLLQLNQLFWRWSGSLHGFVCEVLYSSARSRCVSHIVNKQYKI
jgi:hypothetical protein